jgi:hypothetical protein
MHLDDEECCEENDGNVWESPPFNKCLWAELAHPTELDTFCQRVRNSHRRLNKPLKNFSILQEEYHCDLTQGVYVFHAVAVMVQFSLKHGNPFFPVEYKVSV